MSNSTIDFDAAFDGTRYAQIPEIVLNPSGYPGKFFYGGFDTPLAISQVVSLTVGARYRLQWFASSEDASSPSPIPTWSLPGIAAFEITGYNRTYFTVLHEAGYMTVDFFAKESQVCGFN